VDDKRKSGERWRTPSYRNTKIARARLDHGVTQQELAEATGMSVRTIQELERGEIENPRIRNIVNIAAALGKEWIDLCEDAWLQPGKLIKYQAAPPKSEPLEPVKRLKKKQYRFLIE
jgi:transcriptional regulator with XRE-family HTH domain